MLVKIIPCFTILHPSGTERFAVYLIVCVDLLYDRIITKVATTTGLAGNYYVSVKCTKPNIWYAKGYVVYTDKNGEEQTVYSDVVSYEVK